METIQQKALDMLEHSPKVILTSVDTNDYPRPIVMAKLMVDDISRIWLVTGTNLEKTKHFQLNQKTGLCFTEGGDMVTMIGRVEIFRDRKMREALWKDWMLKHLPGGVDDPEYCILRFCAEEAMYYIGDEFTREKFEL